MNQTQAESDFGGDSTQRSKIEVIEDLEENDTSLWRDRTFWSDITQSWQNKFVEFAGKCSNIRKENFMELRREERASILYGELEVNQVALKAKSKANQGRYIERDEVRAEIRRLTIYGTLKYGMQLLVCEISTLGSIVCFKLMIDYLKDHDDPDAPGLAYAILLFLTFASLRMVTILSRSYYDMHVYNYFRFVQTKIQCWLFELTCSLR